MTKIAFVADVHLGNHRIHGGEAVASLNERCRLGLLVFENAVRLAVEIGASVFVVLGDLFDYQRPEAQLLAAVQRILRRAESDGLRIFILVGNHDLTSSTPGDHALGPLAPYATIVERPTNLPIDRNVRLGLVPFVTGVAADWLPDAVTRATCADPAADFRWQVLGVHLGIADDETPPWLVGSADAIRADRLQEIAADRFSKVFAGNWHNRRQWDGRPGRPEVFQLGALVPTGWDNPGLEGYGTLGIWEDGDLSFQEVDGGPRFLLATQEDAAAVVAEARKLGHVPYLRINAAPDELATARASLEALGVIGDVRADATDITVAARSAATNARAANTIDDSLAGFVSAMSLPEGVERSAVLAKAKAYLRRGE